MYNIGVDASATTSGNENMHSHDLSNLPYSTSRANTDLSLTSRFWRRCQRARNGWKLRGGVIQQVASLVITADQPSEQHVPRAPFGSCTRSHTVVVSDTHHLRHRSASGNRHRASRGTHAPIIPQPLMIY